MATTHLQLSICDDIRIAWADWVIAGHDNPSQVILPESKYQALLKHTGGEDTGIGFSPLVTFRDMRVYAYKGDDIVFS